MGIKGLTKLLQEYAKNSFKEQESKSYFGRKIAIDASMALYQFLVAVRMGGPNGQLANEDGEITSHIIGFFYRTIRLMENGIKPIWVFDGKPPDLKSNELLKRKENRDKAEIQMKEAENEENEEKIVKFERRLVKVTKEHAIEVQKLLDLLGCPWIQANGEAEATCAKMVRDGIVYGTATEDMDALTFGSNKLIRYLTQSEIKKMPILEFDLNKILESLNLDMSQFIDLCILCGCDYTSSIRGIGAKRAYEYICKYKSIEEIIKHIDKAKYAIPEDFLYEAARKLFIEPDVTNCKDLKLEWKNPDEQGVIKYLVEEKNFSEDRVKAGLKRLINSKGKGAQQRLDSFFKPMIVDSSNNLIGKKRKNPDKNEPKAKKQKNNNKK